MYSTILRMFTVATILLTVTAAMPNGRPPYMDCVNSNECGKDECCSIGMGRFSIPSCKPRRDAGEACSPSLLPTSVNVTYPDKAEVMLKNIYYNICPCNDWLVCNRDLGVCSDPADHGLFNDLGNY